METFAIVTSVFGIVVTVACITWTIIGMKANRSFRTLVVSEKKQFMDRVEDLRTLLQGHVDQVVRDREKLGNTDLDTAGIRIEVLQGWIKNLDRFAERLRGIS